MQAGDPVAGAIVRVDERAKDMVTSSQGEFWRLLTPGGNYFCTSTISTGMYTIWAHHEEKSSARVQVEVVEGGEGPRVDLQLVGSQLQFICTMN